MKPLHKAVADKAGAAAAASGAAAKAADQAANEAATIARENGLRYVSDTKPGITRVRIKDGFEFHDAHGKLITDDTVIKRIKSLVIPPAWEDVWICPAANGHIQATGRDARKRKQYRYHAQWRSVRDEAKYERMISFGKALPGIRARLEEDLKQKGLPRTKVLATVVHLLQTTLVRVGNDEYAKTNKSFGLTTLRNRHVRVDGSDVQFSFRGKSGVQHAITLHDPRMAKLIARIRDLPGQDLFQYEDDDGTLHAIGSAEVNEYLHEIGGDEYTAKDFRTWAGTMLAALALIEFEKFDSETQAKRNIVQAIESVAKKLGNTPTICRKCYVHPGVIEAYMDGKMLETLKNRVRKKLVNDIHALTPEEAAVLALLQQRLQQGAKA